MELGAVSSLGRRGKRRRLVLRAISTAALMLALATQGCSCGTSVPTDGDSMDGGPLFGGLDASGYEPTDTGPLPPEPCDVPTRRVTLPVGEGSVHDRLWVSDARAWVYIAGARLTDSPPPALRLFDLERERELDHDLVLGEGDDVLGVFEAPGGFEVVRTDESSRQVVHLDRDGRRTGASDEPLPLSVSPLVRLDDGRYVGVRPEESLSSPVEAALELAAPSGTVERIALGFETRRGYVRALHWNGETLLGLGHADEGSRVVRYEVDPVTSTVRLATLVEGVRVGGTSGSGLAIGADDGIATAAVIHEHVDAPADSAITAELFWWSIGGDDVMRHVVRPPSGVGVAIYALGGEMPRQTLVLAQVISLRTWLTAARVRAPAEVEGGSEPLGVFSIVRDAEAWSPSEGTAAIALLEQQQLEALYVCEGAP